MRVYVQGESVTFGAPPISAEGEGGDRGGKRDKGSFGLVEGREEATARGQGKGKTTIIQGVRGRQQGQGKTTWAGEDNKGRG